MSALVVFLHSHAYDRVYQAISLILTASAMGWPCHLFLFYGALASYMEGTWDDVNITDQNVKAGAAAPAWLPELEKNLELANFPSLYEMLQKARTESGGVAVCACSTSCKVLGMDYGRVREEVDEIIGLPTMLQIAGDAKHMIYI
ncbi:MAG: DsrE family protein [bacterium]|nr:DsrE family protein [bacterium]